MQTKPPTFLDAPEAWNRAAPQRQAITEWPRFNEIRQIYNDYIWFHQLNWLQRLPFIGMALKTSTITWKKIGGERNYAVLRSFCSGLPDVIVTQSL